MLNEIISIYAIAFPSLLRYTKIFVSKVSSFESVPRQVGNRYITDDLLKAIGHNEDCRREMSDAEIITTAICAAMFFNGNHSKACSYMKDHNLISNMLEKSRFNRRLHSVSMLINDLFHQVGMILKEISDSTEYLLDSFPVPICDNIRIFTALPAVMRYSSSN